VFLGIRLGAALQALLQNILQYLGASGAGKLCLGCQTAPRYFRSQMNALR
jgi:hypothetical protein